jgi:hypothetical protein
MLGAARATGAPLDGGGVVFEDDCGLLLLVVQITQHTVKPYHVLRITRSSDVFCLCIGKSDAALILARPVHKIFTEIVQRARYRFAVDVATPVGVRVCNECLLSSSTKHKNIAAGPRQVAEKSLDCDNILSTWCSHCAAQHSNCERYVGTRVS